MEPKEKLKRWFCGFNYIGAVADWATRGTEQQLQGELDKGYVVDTRCWCCTFWRGIAIGGTIGLLAGLLTTLFL